ncbi:hypothetical protein ABTZ99_13345 [Actinosynnema sp. NPDC002837]
MDITANPAATGEQVATALAEAVRTGGWRSLRDPMSMWLSAASPELLPVFEQPALMVEEAEPEDKQALARTAARRWAPVLTRRFASDPKAAAELVALLGLNGEARPKGHQVSQVGFAFDNSRIYQSGGDLHVGRK